MTRYIALLRGINVGGRRRIPMPELREVFEARGLADVSTYLQSGNVLFSSASRVSPPALEAAVSERFGIDVDVVLRTSTQLEGIVANCPFQVRDPKLVHVGFMVSAPEPDNLQLLDLGEFAPEAAEVRGAEIYFYLPNGMARTKLPSYVDRRLEVPTTIRNWNTTTKLLELAAS